MTLGELTRAIEAKRSVAEKTALANARERASFDYKLADLIGRSVARIYNSSTTIPEIEQVYPTLFDSEEVKEAKQQRQDELSTLRFLQFAEAHNKKYKGVKED